MLPQEVMIEKTRELCYKDERLVAALMYGSFALGEGDRFSDIEFYLFFEDEATEGLEEQAWVAQIAPLALYYVNEFGNGSAIFENLVRASSTSRRPPTSAWWTHGRTPGSIRSGRRCWSTRTASSPVGWVGWYDLRRT